MIAGTSAGAQTAAALAIGMSAQEIKEFQRNAPWAHLVDKSTWCCPYECGCFGDIHRLFRHYGYAKGDKLLEYLQETFRNKTGLEDITFHELYTFNRVELKLGVTNLKKKSFEYLSRHSHPDMPISLGCRASSSIPLVFVPVQYEGVYYVDGGMMGNLPVWAFPPEPKSKGYEYSLVRHLAFNLVSDEDQTGPTHPKRLLDFVNDLWQTVSHAMGSKYSVPATKRHRELLQEQGIDVIDIDTKTWGMLDTNMNSKQMEAMWQAGKEDTDKYLNGSRTAAADTCSAHSLHEPSALRS